MSTPARRRLMRDFKRWDNLQNILLDDVNPWEKENYVLHKFQCEKKLFSLHIFGDMIWGKALISVNDTDENFSLLI